MPRKSLHRPVSKILIIVLSSKTFILLSLIFRSLLHFDLILYVVWSRGTASFLSRWISSRPSTVCWNDHSFPTAQGLQEHLMRNRRGKCCMGEGFPRITHLIELHLVLGPSGLPQFLGRQCSWLEKSAQNSVSNSLMLHRLRLCLQRLGQEDPLSPATSLCWGNTQVSERWLAQGCNQLAVAGPRAASPLSGWISVGTEKALSPLQTWRVPGAQGYLWRLWGNELLLWHKLSRK